MQNSSSEYVLQTPRLGLRAWRESDLVDFAAMNADPRVMEFFPSQLSAEESATAMHGLVAHYQAHGFTYFAADELVSSGGGDFVGMVGLKLQTFEHPKSPFVDVGWRLRTDAWGRGLATEAAHACLRFGFDVLRLREIYAIAPAVNLPSLAVIRKLGMHKVDEFNHPAIPDGHPLNPCQLHRASKLLPRPA